MGTNLVRLPYLNSDCRHRAWCQRIRGARKRP